MIDLSDVPPKHPDSSKWYWLEWSAKELNGAIIDSAVWTPPAGITVDESTILNMFTGVRISGGTEGEFVELQVEIHTSNNETLYETLTIEISTKGH